MDKRRPGANRKQRGAENFRAALPANDRNAADHKAEIGMNDKEAGKAQTRVQAETAGATSSIEDAKQRIRKIANNPEESERAMPHTLHDTLLDERNDVMTVINELEDQLDRHQEIREALERELAEANEKVQSGAQRNQELEWQVVSLQTRVEALEQVRQEVALLEEEVASANARLQRMNEEYSTLEKERGRLKNELKAASKQLEELWAVRKERDGLRADVKDLTVKIGEIERGQREWTEERGQLLSRLQETQVAVEEARTERHQHQILLRAAEDRARELSKIQEELTDKIDGIRAEKKNLQAQLTHLERENARLIEQRQFYETELTSLRSMNRNAETALASVKKAFAEVRVALTETKSRARRRMIETWPRIGIPLRGMDGEATTPTAAARPGFHADLEPGIEASHAISTLDEADGDNGEP